MLDKLSSIYDNQFIFPEHLLDKYIRALKLDTYSGVDFISSEHVKYARESSITLHFCKLLTTCFRTGVVPTSFTKGILVPILKKSTLDPAIPSNYRPIIVSTVLSKIVEMYKPESCPDVQFIDYQFGFGKDRGTNTTIHSKKKGFLTVLCRTSMVLARTIVHFRTLFKKL